jgi:hypothetical protein
MTTSIQLGVIHSIVEDQAVRSKSTDSLDDPKRRADSPDKPPSFQVARQDDAASNRSQSTLPNPEIVPEDPQEIVDSQELPPADGGKQAWGFLTAAFALEMIVWGMFRI